MPRLRNSPLPEAPQSKLRGPRLFMLLLLAFALVIVLGVGGMVGLYTLSGARLGAGDTSTSADSYLTVTRAMTSRALADYYAIHGSWLGVDETLLAPQFGAGSAASFTYALLDAQGQAVASNQSSFWPHALLAPYAPGATEPLTLNGQAIGTLVLSPRQGSAGGSAFFASRGDALRGFISAGLALAAILLGLAAFFSSRLSRPLIRLTRAAQTVAAGDLTVRVQGGSVREIAALAQAFNTMADSLAQADQQRRQLTADVAHELRTPLSIIRGRLEGMQDGVYTATPDQIDVLLDETALLERLIEDLRLLALADAGQLPLYPEPFEPVALLHDVARSFAPQATAAGLTLHVVALPGLPEVAADPQRIAQVLGNLLSNALRYTPPGGSVTLRAGWGPSVPGPALLLEVADSGVGIAPEDLPRIFDRFWRADRSRSRRSGGTGLGLVIARRLVEAHGGQIWVASTPGQGTTVSFSLPLAATLPAGYAPEFPILQGLAVGVPTVREK